jgi:orotate phosphoribosyltransferase
MVAIFSYGFDIAAQNFEKANVELHTLSNYENLLEQAEKSSYISGKEKTLLDTWRENPAVWKQ